MRKLLDKMSGRHVTIIACVAILAPSALMAAVTYSNVAIVNPTTGAAAFVDAAGRMSVMDPFAFYKNYPGNAVEIVVHNSGSAQACESTQQWTVPAGKAFVITAMTGYQTPGDLTLGFSGVMVYDGPYCQAKLVAADWVSPSASAGNLPLSKDFGVGIPVPAGSTISVQSFNDGGYTMIHGYLVPASTISGAQIVGP